MSEETIEVIECEQGGPEWYAARAGVITASMFIEFMERLKSGPNKGGYRKKADDYAFALAVERISGEPLQGADFETYAMRRGHELEPVARDLHADIYNVEIQRAGFVRTKDRKFGVSADGLILKKEGAEYKCLTAPERLKSVLIDGDIDEFIPQCQGALWLTGREVWHLGFYCPQLAAIGKDLTIFPIERDEAMIERIANECLEFDRLVEQYRTSLGGEPDVADAFG